MQVLVQFHQLVVHCAEPQANRLMGHEEQLRHEPIACFFGQRLHSFLGYQWCLFMQA